MHDDDSREWIFQLNIAGLTLLHFASSYIGQHLAMLLPVSGLPRVLLHYFGELVLTAVAFGYAMWRAFGASEPQRGRVDWLKRSAVWLYVGLGAVMEGLSKLPGAILRKNSGKFPRVVDPPIRCSTNG